MYHPRVIEAKKGPGIEASGCSVRAYTTHSAQYRAIEAGSTTKNHVDSGSAEIAPARPAIESHKLGREEKREKEYANLGMNLACEKRIEETNPTAGEMSFQ
jgi:hypothetical protein